MEDRFERNILVTGGFGFIGSHLVERLLSEKNTHVHVVDDLSTSPVDVKSYTARIKASNRLTYSICTLRDYLDGDSVPQYDEVYHLASVVGPVGVLKHGGQILGSIVHDTYAVANYCLRAKSRLCDVSTSEVYGGGRDGYCSEKDAMIIPPKISIRLEYAVAKLGAEVALINMARTAGLNVSIVRPFNVAGPRQSANGGFVLPRFILQALSDEPITVYGDGLMVRAFTHVRDIVAGIIRVLRGGKPGEAYNIGNPANKTNILRLAKLVNKMVGTQSPISFLDPKQLWGPLFEEANDKYPDADRAIHELGWVPEFSLEQIIRETVSYIREGRKD